MLVAELEVGHVYRIRTDKPIHICLHRGFIDIHTGGGWEPEDYRIVKNELLLYLGRNKAGHRKVLYRGKEYYGYSNIWQHLRLIE